MEELRFYLDLVDRLGDPFTVFERDWSEDDTPVDSSGRHALRDDPTDPRGFPISG
ncbi:MAG: hypothetical protein WC054_00370 [Candidatus Nanopelagicales bacterium]